MWHLLSHPGESLQCGIVARSRLLKLLKEGSLYLSNASPCVKRYVGLQMPMALVDTERKLVWPELSSLDVCAAATWCVAGVFNITRCAHERFPFGRSTRDVVSTKKRADLEIDSSFCVSWEESTDLRCPSNHKAVVEIVGMNFNALFEADCALLVNAP